MKKIQIWLFGFLLLGISVPSWAKIIYVNKNALGGNNGTSWINAYNELSQALPTAQYGDEVWVAQGTYKPYLEGITNSFNMISGVKLLGGFSGWETNQNQRNWKLNETILTAQYMVSQNGVVFPPYNIIYCIATDSTTLVDGFTFRDVLAGPFNGEPCAANQHNCFGGGIFLYSSTPTFPTYLSINNCRFLNNCCAAGGSAIGVNFSEGSGGFAIRHCYFNGNQALEGGALSIGVGSAPQHKMIIDSCIFEENNANTVGAISIYNGNVNLNFTISNSTFIKNTAKNGGCISHQSNNNVSPLKIKQSSFISNEAGDLISQPGTGGSILGRNFHISNCLFKQNKAFIGGAINADWLIIENSLFIDNLATREGGAIRTYLSNYFLNTTFVNNRTGLRGGAIFHGGFAGAHDTIINCLFYGNKANGLKEWMATYGADVFLTNSYVDAENCDSLKTTFSVGDSLFCEENLIFNIDPLFRDTTMEDFSLSGCSPLLNQGDSTWVAQFGLLTDLAGNNRWKDGIPDIGAYETSIFHTEAEWLNVSCNGLEDGAINLVVHGGIQPYSFLWNDNSQDSSRSQLMAGTYMAIVRDIDHCTDTLNVTIVEPDSLSIEAIITHNSNSQSPNGSITLINVYGGTMPYKYTWSTGSIEDSITDLSSGLYTISVTDEQGCIITSEFEILLVNNAIETTDLQQLVVFPNPAYDQVIFSTTEPFHKSTQLTLFNIHGQIIKSSPISGRNSYTLTVDDLSSGFYFWVLSDPIEIVGKGRLLIQH